MNGSDDDDEIETCGEYRKVSLHAGQSPDRLRVVKADIDAAYKIRSIQAGLDFIKNARHAPEARLAMESILEARFASAVRGRERRPALDLDYLHALTAGLNSRTWQNPRHYGSLLNPDDGVPREQPLIKGNK